MRKRFDKVFFFIFYCSAVDCFIIHECFLIELNQQWVKIKVLVLFRHVNHKESINADPIQFYSNPINYNINIIYINNN